MPGVLLIRHAQASFGSADYDVLSEHGHAQVQALVAGLEARGVRATRVVCGDLQRQRDTAEPCAAAAGLTAEIDPRWNEYSDRDILAHHAEVPAGLNHESGDAALDSRQFQAILNDALHAWVAAGADGPCDEPHPAFASRAQDALRGLVDGLGRGEVAIAVSSGGVIAALVAAIMGLAPGAMVALNHVAINAAITKLTVGRGGISVISINEHGHLETGAGSLVTYR